MYLIFFTYKLFSTSLIIIILVFFLIFFNVKNKIKYKKRNVNEREKFKTNFLGLYYNLIFIVVKFFGAYIKKL